MKTVKLNNNILIPLVGIGTNTFGKVDNMYQNPINFDTKELSSAIKVGYRLIDTAISYRNEAVIGKAWQESGLSRDNFILTTKLPGGSGYLTNREVDEAVRLSLTNLATNYIDIFLMHHPWDNNEEMVNVYKRLEYHVEKGSIKTIGVSNFNEEELQLILDNAKIKPAINQIASYPGNWQDDLIMFNQKNGVVVQAWSPLNHVDDKMKEVLNKIGSKYNKTWAQVILNYQVSRNVVVIPKSHRLAGQKENFEIFDFTLTEAEKSEIKAL